MKIYFTGSLHNKDIDKQVYSKIVEQLKSLGHKVIADHILNPSIKDIELQKPSELHVYYKKMNNALVSSEAMVCEVSYPSTINIGHEVSLALDKGIPIVALYQKNRAPGISQGIVSDKLILLEYAVDDVRSVLEYSLEEADAQMDVRFNFFVSPEISTYLDTISKKKRVPRAVYLRRLIEVDMRANKEYNKA